MIVYLSKEDISSDELIKKGVDGFCRLFNLPRKEYSIIRAEGAKPVLEPPFLHFNLSHSGEYKALAVSQQPVGVDVQQHRPCDFKAVTDRFFHADERISGSKDFFDLWAAKEAYAKCGDLPLQEGLREKIKGEPAVFGILEGYSLAAKSADKEILFVFLF